jgi:hypothetical protein
MQVSTCAAGRLPAGRGRRAVRGQAVERRAARPGWAPGRRCRRTVGEQPEEPVAHRGLVGVEPDRAARGLGHLDEHGRDPLAGEVGHLGAGELEQRVDPARVGRARLAVRGGRGDRVAERVRCPEPVDVRDGSPTYGRAPPRSPCGPPRGRAGASVVRDGPPAPRCRTIGRSRSSPAAVRTAPGAPTLGRCAGPRARRARGRSHRPRRPAARRATVPRRVRRATGAVGRSRHRPPRPEQSELPVGQRPAGGPLVDERGAPGRDECVDRFGRLCGERRQRPLRRRRDGRARAAPRGRGAGRAARGRRRRAGSGRGRPAARWPTAGTLAATACRSAASGIVPSRYQRR